MDFNCQLCELCQSRKQVVPPYGNFHSQIALVGEAPGEQEDLQGFPFVGRSGALLDKMIATFFGGTRREVYITNAVKCRPPKNRTPSPEEIRTCLGYLGQELNRLEPSVILCLGKSAATAVFQLFGLDVSGDSMGHLRTADFPFYFRPTSEHPKECHVLVTYHPSYLLRQGGNIEISRLDFERAKTFIG